MTKDELFDTGPDKRPVPVEWVNAAMAWPERLASSDGREYEILTWQPQVSRGQGGVGPVNVLIEAVVVMPGGPEKKS